MPALAAEPAPHQDPWLHARLHEKTATFRSHIRSAAHFRDVQEQYADLVRHPVDNCVPPAWDPTMPTTDREMVHYVKRLFDAIVDFSDVSDKSVPVKRGAGGSHGMAQPWGELTASEKVKDVVRTELSDVELEMLCWNVLVSSYMLLNVCEAKLTGVVGRDKGAEGGAAEPSVVGDWGDPVGGVQTLRGPLGGYMQPVEGEFLRP